MATKKSAKHEDDEENRNIGFRITEDELWEAFNAFRESQRIRPKKTDIIIVALQEFLRKEGYYHPD